MQRTSPGREESEDRKRDRASGAAPLRILAVLVGVIWLGCPAGLALDPATALADYRLTNWTRESGLPQNAITAITHDGQSYLWVGTQGGLARFDGLLFTVLDRHNQPALSDDFITSLAVDGDRTLWIGTRAGLVRKDQTGLERFTAEDGLPDDYVRSLLLDQAGRLWVGTYGGGLARRRDGGFEPGPPAGELGAAVVRALHETREGALWIGSSTGLFRIGRDGSEAVRQDSGLRGDFVRALASDSHGTLWAGAEGGGLQRRTAGRFSPYSARVGLPFGTTVRSLHADRRGGLWVGTNGRGLTLLRGGAASSLGRSDGLASDVVLSLHEDHEGSLWVGTRQGLTQLRDTSIVTLTARDGLHDEFVRTVFEDSDQTLWVGTHSGLESWTLQGGGPRFQKRWLEGRRVRTVAQRSNSALLVGTRQGVMMLVGAGFVPAPWSDDLPGEVVNAIVEDERGCLWVGTHAGLARVCEGQVEVFGPEHGLLSPVVRSLLAGDGGRLWVGTEDGLSHIEEGRLATTMTTDDGLPSGFVYSLLEDEDGVLWVGTAGGLARVEGDSVTGTIGRQELVFQILEDRGGHLWLTGKNGVRRVSKSGVDDSHRPSDSSPARVFDEADGMTTGECNGGTQPAGWRSTDGRLWFPTTRGLSFIRPDRIPPQPDPPQVQIERVIADGNDFQPDRLIHLPAGTEDVAFHYSAPTFLSPERLRFRFRLEGVHDSWHEVGQLRVAHFTNLGPGRHRFAVTVARGTGEWREESADVTLLIAPYFWQTSWFRILLVATLLAAGPLVHRLRMRQARLRERQLANLVDRQTAALKRLATTDDLTGVANHRLLASTLEKEWKRLGRSEKALSLILIDIDHFKLYNDHYGHLAGDRVLRRVAQALHRALSRATDMVARYGGEEFLVILPETGHQGALTVAETLRLAIEDLDIAHERSPTARFLTISLGVASSNPSADGQSDDLLAAADRALYRAKDEGRNRVWPEQP